MRGSAVLVVAAGLALAGAAFSLPAHAGVFSAAGHAKLNATSVVKVSWPPWWAAKLGYDVSAWRGLSRDGASHLSGRVVAGPSRREER